MRPEDFEQNEMVCDFLDWLRERLPELQVDLAVRPSRFVPGGINVQGIAGPRRILEHYRWVSACAPDGTFQQNHVCLACLSCALRAAVQKRDSEGTLNACRYILEWGGDRNGRVGAGAFLRHLHESNDTVLPDYIRSVGNALRLAEAIVSLDGLAAVLRMNSMLVKIHSLYADDGLPIYDSRVAAAIAVLVEMWRRSRRTDGAPLPPALLFPATQRSRSVLSLFPQAHHHPGFMDYLSAEMAVEWAGATVRLGWLLRKCVEEPRWAQLDAYGMLPARMRAIEAALFMIGYDVRCLARAANVPLPMGLPPGGGAPVVMMTTWPLSGNGQAIRWWGSLERGIHVIQWGRTYAFSLEPETLQELITEFKGRTVVPLGACRTGEVPADSLGQWLIDNRCSSRECASALAPILVKLGIAVSIREGNRILLSFPNEG
jgi:hypothetical protein